MKPLGKESLAAIALAPRRRHRVADRRAGLAGITAEVAAHLASEGPRRLRAVFEEAVVRLLGLRHARLSVGQTMATGPTPVLRERCVIEVAVSSGLAVLEVIPDGPRVFDEWDWQVLNGLGHLAALVLEIERAQGLLRASAPRRFPPPGLVGSSEPMRALRDRIQRVARREVPVLIEGESGVGKELVARQIHEFSPRSRGPFVAVNCAALVESLLEAELFGIEDRTATGVKGRRGRFELADGGTLFLDEIADLSGHAQAKLLRALQEHAIERVGGHGTHRVDVRLVAATNRSLTALVEQGRFRQDLFYRLNCVEIQVPPLRERRHDILELIEFFLGRTGDTRGLHLTPEAIDALRSHHWPGNVRELQRVIERAVTLAEASEITLHQLPASVVGRHQEVLLTSIEGRETLRRWASRYARITLERCHNNKREACRVLGITYHTLQAYLRHDECAERAASRGH